MNHYLLIDIDHTLFPYFFAQKLMQSQVEKGLIDAHVYDSILSLLDEYKSKKRPYISTINRWNEIWVNALIGKNLKQIQATNRTISEKLKTDIRPFFKDLLAATKPIASIKTLLVTSEPENVAEVLASVIGADGAIGTYIQTDDHDIITGDIRVLTQPEDKPKAILARGIKKDQILAAFGDSISDLGILEMAKHPFCVNPNNELRQIVEPRNWIILDDQASFSDYSHLILQ